MIELSKMQTDSTFVRIFAAVLGTLAAQALAAEGGDAVEATDNTLSSLSESVFTGKHAAGSLVLGLASFGLQVLVRVWGSQVKEALSWSIHGWPAFFTVCAVAQAALGDLITVPFYLANFVFPMSLFGGILVTFVHFKVFGLDTSKYVMKGITNTYDKAKVKDALDNKTGNDLIAFFVDYTKNQSYTFDDKDAIKFVSRAVKTDTAKLDGPELVTMKAAITVLIDKGKSLAKQDILEGDDLKTLEAIEALLLQSEKALRLSDDETKKGIEEKFERKKADDEKDPKKKPAAKRDFTALVDAAIAKPNVETDLKLLVEAWAEDAKKSIAGLKPKMITLGKKLVDLLNANNFPSKNGKAAASLAAVEKALAALNVKEVKEATVPTEKDLDVVDKLEDVFAFAPIASILKGTRSSLIAAIIDEKFANDKKIKNLSIVQPLEDTFEYTLESIKSTFIPNFKCISDLIKKGDTLFEDLDGENIASARGNLAYHVEAVINHITRIKKSHDDVKVEANELYTVLSALDTSKVYNQRVFEDPLMEMLIAVDPAMAAGYQVTYVTNALVKAMEKKDDFKDILGWLISGKNAILSVKEKKNASKGNEKAIEALMGHLNKALSACKTLLTGMCKLASTAENLATLEENLTLLNTPDVPRCKFFDKEGSETAGVLDAEKEALKKYVAKMKIDVKYIDLTKSLKEAEADTKNPFTTMCGALGEVTGELVENESEKYGEFVAAANSLSNKILTTVKDWAAKKGDKAPTTLEDLNKMRDIAGRIENFSGTLKNSQLGIKEDPNLFFFKSAYEELKKSEKEAREAAMLIYSQNIDSSAENIAKKTIVDLITDTVIILDYVPENSSLKGLVLTENGEVYVAYGKFKDYVAAAVKAVKTRCDEAAKTKLASQQLVQQLSDAGLIEDGKFKRIYEKKFSSCNALLFQEVNNVIKEANP